MSKQKFIVAEVAKTWSPSEQDRPIISEKFEYVINQNFARGYALREWKLSSHFNVENKSLLETIVAVFELIDSEDKTIKVHL